MALITDFTTSAATTSTQKFLTGDGVYDSPAEWNAVADLSDYNEKTGPLAGDSIVRLIKNDGAPYIFAWINPHFHDPVAVKIYADRPSAWAFMDDPEEEGQWNTDLQANKMAADIVNILADHRETLLGQSSAPQPAPV